MNKVQQESLSKLQSEQEKALGECRDKLLKWKKFHNDYVVLLNCLETIPDRISHEVMVPFGSVAFMPGQLIHTNEIMVLLGDNWFADRSAKQASDIVRRRIGNCEKTIDSLEKEILQFENWKQYTTSVKEETEKFVEIVEDYDEDTEKDWREKHKLRMKEHREQRDAPANSTSVDNEFWQRLDELELEEFEASHLARAKDVSNLTGMTQMGLNQIDQQVSTADSVCNRSSSRSGRKVVWKDDLLDVLQPPAADRVVKVDFSEPLSRCGPEANPVNMGKGSNLIRSPADIYALFGANQKSKSILKKSPSFVIDSSPTHDVNKTIHSPVTPEATSVQQIEAVSAVVTERAPDKLDAGVASTVPRKVSKFKSQRQANM